MRTLIVLLALVAVSSVAWGQESGKSEPSTLTVSASGTVMAPPDMAIISLGVETSAKLLMEAQRRNSAVMQRVMERLREFKVDKERIQTTSFVVTPQYRPPSKQQVDLPVTPSEIIGYSVSNQLSVEVREMEKVAAIIDASLAVGANHFHGLQWVLQDEQPRRLSALQLAAGKAREKAAILSQALKVKLARVLNVSEGGHVVQPTPYMGRAMASMESAAVPVSSGELTVEATVTIIYEIVQE